MPNDIIYFDNAATTFPKPQGVIAATIDCMENYCGNPGRSSHNIALRSAEKVYECRELLGKTFACKPENAIFTLNTTYALNMAIKGVMCNGGHMLISNLEHNSVLRPVEKLMREKKIKYDIFEAYRTNQPLSEKEIIENIISKLRKDTKMLVCIHSSNICSYTLPIREIGRLCRRYGIVFAVDAAQSAGHIPINMEEDYIDILCLPAHKGLYSPQGCGIMLINDGIHHKVTTLIEGGNGIQSLSLSMGTTSPEKYEGGTLSTPSIAGLCAGLEFVNGIGIKSIYAHEVSLWKRAFERLSNIKNIRIYDSTPGGVLLFNISNILADDLGNELSERGFCLRSGYHCSPLAHKALNTAKGGAVRIGFGVFNTLVETDKLCDTIKMISEQS